MVDCTPNPRHCGGTGGCQGATAELAMEFVMKHGCADETEVPYAAADGQCTVEGAKPVNKTAKNVPQTIVFAETSSALSSSSPSSGALAIGMTGWETLPINKYEPLVRALAERGPVAVSACASDWGQYESGIFNGCGKDCVVNHAVTAVGYGESNGVKYWTIQNSWGAFWGEQGHIRLQRHEEGWCGMNNDPQAGVACEGETAPVPVCGMCGVLFDSVVPHFKKSIA
jgi:cathepsin L